MSFGLLSRSYLLPIPKMEVGSISIKSNTFWYLNMNNQVICKIILYTRKWIISFVDDVNDRITWRAVQVNENGCTTDEDCPSIFKCNAEGKCAVKWWFPFIMVLLILALIIGAICCLCCCGCCALSACCRLPGCWRKFWVILK